MRFSADWLQVTRVLTQYVAPGLVVLALVVELTGLSFSSPALASAYSYLVAVVFSLLTIVMIGVCGWIVFLWDIDRLFGTQDRCATP
jgi:FtsH-binding integral membrane protein